MIDFVRIDLLDQLGVRNEHYKIKQILRTMGFEPGTNEANSISVAPLVEMRIKHLNFDHVLPEFAI